jgi:hypothetical protein
MSPPDRQGPAMGEVDLRDVEFRRARQRRSGPDGEHPHAGLWWRIALGVFVGMLTHSIVVGIYLRWEMSQSIKLFAAEAEKAEREFQGGIEELKPQRNTPRRTPAARVRPLAPGERCVAGKRFRRVENGWVQVNEACR